MQYLLSHWKSLYFMANALETIEGKKWIDNKSFNFQIFTVSSVHKIDRGRENM